MVYGRFLFTLFPRNTLVDLVELGMLYLDLTLSIDVLHTWYVFINDSTQIVRRIWDLESVWVITFWVRWQLSTMSSSLGIGTYGVIWWWYCWMLRTIEFFKVGKNVSLLMSLGVIEWSFLWGLKWGLAPE